MNIEERIGNFWRALNAEKKTFGIEARIKGDRWHSFGDVTFQDAISALADQQRLGPGTTEVEARTAETPNVIYEGIVTRTVETTIRWYRKD